MLKNLFKLDLRSLALARVLLGILAFFDIARRIPDINTFFTDTGILPRWNLLEQMAMRWRMSLLNLNGSYTFALIVALVGMLAAITFTLGWRTRLSNFIVWITLISFQARFPEGAAAGGEALCRIFLFWSLFLPMSARYSVDRAVSGTEVKENEFFSIFSVLWIVQIMLLYIFTFLHKWTPVYHTDFNAVWFILQLDIYTTPFGKWLGQYYTATRFLSVASYALEILGPLMLLIPYRRDLFRGIAVVSFWCFHIGIGLTLHLGNFVPICLIIWVGLIPTTWWDFLAEKMKASTQSTMDLYYDVHSGFARKLAVITKELLFLETLRLVPSRLLEQNQKFVLEDNEKNLISGTAMVPKLLINSKISLIRSVGKIFSSKLSLFLNEATEVGEVSFFSNTSKRDRGQQTKSSFHKAINFTFETIGFAKVKTRVNRFESIFGIFILILIIAWNVEGYAKNRKWRIGSPFDEIMLTLQLSQGWAMFAPHPQRSDGWWIMEGVKEDGTKWDALNNKAVSFARPNDIHSTYPTVAWRIFLNGLQASRSNYYLNLLGQHLCRRWNAGHVGKDGLSGFQLYYMREFTKGPKEPPAEAKKVKLLEHSCFKI